MTGKGTGVIGPRGLLAVLGGCVLAAAASGPAAAERSGPNPEPLWRAYPLEQSPSAPALRPRRVQRAESPRDTGTGAMVAVGAAASGALLAGGVLALLGMRKRRRAPALRASLATPPVSDAPPARSPPQRKPEPPAAETCWIVCWHETGRAAFCAIARDADGHQQSVGESPAFPATPNGPLVLDDAAFDALQSLTARLAGGGWEAAAPVGARGATWHAQEFRRKNAAKTREHRGRDPSSSPRGRPA